MKAFFQVIAIALLISITGLAGHAETTTRKQNELAQGQSTRVEDKPLPVALRESATVWPNKGNSMSGLLTAFNQQGLTISQDDFSQTLQIDQIKRVEFQGSVWIPGSSGPRKIRGPEKTSSGQQIWRGVSVTALDWQGPSKTAMLRLGAVLSGEELQDLLSIAADNIYVVEEIVFESPGKMTIKAAPVER